MIRAPEYLSPCGGESQAKPGACVTPPALCDRAWKRRLLLLLCFVAFGVCEANALREHPSAYLALHGDDPVDWRPLGADALREARALNRPLLLSSGYFACHWCHVMQHESWRDPEIAALLNSYFVPVKIDRELDPGIDDFLIGFAERNLGQAGWPLNVLVTPRGHPFYAALYLPPEDVKTLLRRTVRLWSGRAEELSDLASRAAQERLTSTSTPKAEALSDPTALIDALRSQALSLGDPLSGGFGQQTRFPMAPQLSALLSLQHVAPSPELAELLDLTLERMATQGLYDLLAGGFFRYTVDPGWQVPHFEKMLYTQALLAPVYLRSATILDRPGDLLLATRTLDFMLNSMRRADGLFAASLSAIDAQGVEGGSYLWDADELARVLTPDQRAAVALAWGLTGPGELEAGSLPRLIGTPEGLRIHGFEPAGLAATLADAADRLLLWRTRQRQIPRDAKALVGWNGLALSALSKGARVLNEPRYRRAGQALRDGLVGRAWRGGELRAVCHLQDCDGPGSIADYAYLAQGLADWAEATDSKADRMLGQEIARVGFERFLRDGSWQFSADPILPDMPGQVAFSDAPLPAPDAVLLGLLLADPQAEWRERAGDQLRRMTASIVGAPFDHASAAWLLVAWANARAAPAADPQSGTTYGNQS